MIKNSEFNGNDITGSIGSLINGQTHAHRGEDDTPINTTLTLANITDLAYDGQYLSFIVNDFCEYGYAAVPEPSTYAVIFGGIALGLVMYRRRK